MAHENLRIIFIPGNMGGNPTKDRWFPFLKTAFEALGYTVIAKPFPDSVLARESRWVPFIESLGADANTILIAHSSGTLAAMRYAQKHEILGSVLVAAYHTHFWNPIEMLSGYFAKPWDFQAIKKNQKFIIQFASKNDGVIPVRESRQVHEFIGGDYTEFPDRNHFPQKEFPEIVEKVTAAVSALSLEDRGSLQA